jgi:hypothetical protein
MSCELRIDEDRGEATKRAPNLAIATESCTRSVVTRRCRLSLVA